MIKVSDVKLSPFDTDYKKAVAKALKTKETDILNIEILRKSLDCRKRDFIHYVFTFKVQVKNEERFLKLKNVSKYVEDKYEFPYKKTEGKIIKGNNLSTKQNLQLKIIFNETDIDQTLDYSYIKDDNRISIEFN